MVSLISSSLVFFFTGVEVFSFSLSSLGKDTSSDLSGDKPCSVSTLGLYLGPRGRGPCVHSHGYRYIQGMYRYIQVYIGMKAPLGENIGIHGYIWG